MVDSKIDLLEEIVNDPFERAARRDSLRQINGGCEPDSIAPTDERASEMKDTQDMNEAAAPAPVYEDLVVETLREGGRVVKKKCTGRSLVEEFDSEAGTLSAYERANGRLLVLVECKDQFGSLDSAELREVGDFQDLVNGEDFPEEFVAEVAAELGVQYVIDLDR